MTGRSRGACTRMRPGGHGRSRRSGDGGSHAPERRSEGMNEVISVNRTREEAFQLLADDLVKEGFLRLVALVVGHLDPVRDRVGV